MEESKFELSTFREAPLTYILVALNVIIFLLTDLKGDTNNYNYMVKIGGMNPALVLYSHQYWRLLTATFLHFGVEHLVNNMLMLFIIGQMLERMAGTVRFAVIYLTSGVFASFCSFIMMLVNRENNVSAGASGAVFGIVGGLLLVIIAHKGKYEGLTTRKLLLMIALTLYYGFVSSNVDNVGHVTGLIMGMLLGLFIYAIPYWVKKMVEKNS